MCWLISKRRRGTIIHSTTLPAANTGTGGATWSRWDHRPRPWLTGATGSDTWGAEGSRVLKAGRGRGGYHPGFLVLSNSSKNNCVVRYDMRFGFDFFFLLGALVLRAFLSYKSGAGSYCYYCCCRCCAPLFLLLHVSIAVVPGVLAVQPRLPLVAVPLYILPTSTPSSLFAAVRVYEDTRTAVSSE